MSQFYLMFTKGPTVSGKLMWSHYVELLKFSDLSEINYYIKITEEQNLSVRELRDKIKNKYKIKIGNRYNYIDLLLFNYKYNCFTVVELKVTELKKEHIGQIQTYMNYINKNIKDINQNETIGIIICKKGNELIMEYCSDSRIFETTYTVN